MLALFIAALEWARLCFVVKNFLLVLFLEEVTLCILADMKLSSVAWPLFLVLPGALI